MNDFRDANIDPIAVQLGNEVSNLWTLLFRYPCRQPALTFPLLSTDGWRRFSPSNRQDLGGQRQ